MASECSHCGARVFPSDTVCVTCGEALNASVAGPSQHLPIGPDDLAPDAVARRPRRRGSVAHLCRKIGGVGLVTALVAGLIWAVLNQDEVGILAKGQIANRLPLKGFWTDFDERDAEGLTRLQRAVIANRPRIVAALLAANTDPDVRATLPDAEQRGPVGMHLGWDGEGHSIMVGSYAVPCLRINGVPYIYGGPLAGEKDPPADRDHATVS